MPGAKRGRKRKIKNGTSQEESESNRPTGTTKNDSLPSTSGRTTRSTSDQPLEKQGRSIEGSENASIFEGTVFPDPRQIVLSKGKTNKTNQGNKSSIISVNESSLNNGPVTSVNGSVQTRNSDLAAVDSGKELDYEDNLDLQVTVSQDDQHMEDGSQAQDDEGALLAMMKGNPRLKELFKKLIDTEQSAEKQVDKRSDGKEGSNQPILSKSLSDSTLYAPALNCLTADTINKSPILRNRVIERSYGKDNGTRGEELIHDVNALNLNADIKEAEPAAAE